MNTVTASTTPRGARRASQRRRERILAFATLVLIAIVWIVGAARSEADLMPAVRAAFPQAGHFERVDNGVYAARADSSAQAMLGYVVISSADGYGGPLQVAVAVNEKAEIIGLTVVDHKDTPSWYNRVTQSGLIESLVGKPYSDAFALGADVDSVTGATYTSRAIAEAALIGSRTAARLFNLPVAEAAAPEVQFGLPEITVLALFGVGYVGHRREFSHKKQARWGGMLVGLVVLGFLYNIPITLAYFVKGILGYWPDWQTNLYWYFLIGGLLSVLLVTNKNAYCEWMCPFGAAQECMGVIGGAKPYTIRNRRDWFKWARRLIVLVAVLFAVFFRSPGLASIEVFGTLFSLYGGTLEIAILALVLLAALFIKRPWCNYLCPVDAVVEMVHVIRQPVKELWDKVNPKTKVV